jgi:hypothetical protein
MNVNKLENDMDQIKKILCKLFHEKYTGELVIRFVIGKGGLRDIKVTYDQDIDGFR